MRTDERSLLEIDHQGRADAVDQVGQIFAELEGGSLGHELRRPAKEFRWTFLWACSHDVKAGTSPASGEILTVAFTTVANALIIPGNKNEKRRQLGDKGGATWTSATSPSATITTRTTRGRRTSSSPRSPRRRCTPTGSACIRPGSASTISTHSAYCPAPTWCSPISPRAPSTSGWRRR